ncbi:La ribonucleoprotein [Phakopsora pachyrhizi]|nr:La ribonucleoprotein [Phakopsora pachyrhizi]
MSVQAEADAQQKPEVQGEKNDTTNEKGSGVTEEGSNAASKDECDEAPKNEDDKTQAAVGVEGVDEQDRLGVIKQVEFYLSDANLPYDKFMFLQTSPHLDHMKASTLSPEAKEKAESYGPGRSPILLQTVASFKRMRQYSEKFPTSKIAQILQTSTTEPKLLEVLTEDLNGKPTFFVRRLLELKELNRVGASDRCVYVKGFLSDEDLAKGEPENIQVRLEDWGKGWGDLSVLRMRRDDPNAKNASKSKDDADAKKDRKKDKKWKNSVFIEFKDAHSAEKLVKDFKEGPEKPKFESRELESIMFKIDYVTKKAIEKGLAPPKISGNRKAADPTTSTLGALGGNSSTFNAFKEMKAVSEGKKEYVAGPFLNSKADKESKKEKALEIEYEGNTLEVNKDGSLKDVAQLKTLPENLALGFKLKGDEPKDYKEARVNFRELKESLNDGDFVCQFVSLDKEDKSSGFLGFNKQVDEERFTKLQGQEIKAGGRVAELRRLKTDENRNYHLEFATQKARALTGTQNSQRSNRAQGGKGGGKWENRRGGKGGRGQNGRNGNGRGDRNSEKNNSEKAERSKSDPEQIKSENSNESASKGKNQKKRDAEGNIIGTNGSGAPQPDSVPEIARADKKAKIEA